MPVGTFYVTGASAYDAQTVRLVFVADALDFSPFGPRDALNPNNYVVSVVSGPGAAPAVLKVLRVAGSTTRFDVVVDSPLRYGTTYRVQVANVTGETGDPLGYPDFGDAAGVFAVPTRPSRSTPSGSDLAVDIVSGRVLLDARSDLALLSRAAGVRDRAVKRMIVAPGGFSHLPTFGRGLRLKARLLSAARLPEERNALLDQLAQEDDLTDAKVGLALGGGVLTVTMTGRTKSGQELTARFPVEVS